MKWLARIGTKYSTERGSLVLLNYKKKSNESIYVLGVWVGMHNRTYSRVGTRKYANLIELARGQNEIYSLLRTIPPESSKLNIDGLKSLIRKQWRTFTPPRLLGFKVVSAVQDDGTQPQGRPEKTPPQSAPASKADRSSWLSSAISWVSKKIFRRK